MHFPEQPTETSAMAELCKFTDMETEQVIYINPSAVRLVRRDWTKEGTQLVLHEAASIVVSEPVEEVVKTINSAFRSQAPAIA
jgi:thiamine phosphate synthase YjbQ (UPF0047 family)